MSARRLRAAGLTCPAMLITGYADGPTVVRALHEKLIERIVAKPYEAAALRAEVELTIRLASARSSVTRMKSRLMRR